MHSNQAVSGYVLRMAGVPMGELVAMMLGRRHRHSYNESFVSPTCEKEGYTVYCCDCGESYRDDVVAALGHMAGNPVEEHRVEATHEVEGSYDEVVYCTRCGHEMSRVSHTLPLRTLKGYLYNGVMLPFESRMMEKDRYLVWMKDGGDSYTLFVMAQPLPVNIWSYDDGKGNSYPAHDMRNATAAAVTYSKYWGVAEGDTRFSASYRSENQSVKAGGVIPIPAFTETPNVLFWSNYDVYEAVKVNGSYVQTETLLMPKCPEPVAIYE